MPEFYTLVIAHLVGDFLFQTHKMAASKRSSSAWCTFHVLVYILPVWLVGCHGLLLYCIGMQHWIQDRFSLALRWMTFVGQSSAKDWPTGPLIVDQVLHLVFIWIFYSVSEISAADPGVAQLEMVRRSVAAVLALG